jgi:hypothetical protein
MKKTIVTIACDWCHQIVACTDRNPIHQYNIIGPDLKLLSRSPVDLHEKCEQKFYDFAVFLGAHTDIHIGLQKVE